MDELDKFKDEEFPMWMCRQCFCMTKHRNERCLKCEKKDFPRCIVCGNDIHYRGSLGSMELDGLYIEHKHICSDCARRISIWFAGWA